MAAPDFDELYAQVVTHAQMLGVFSTVITHEPISAPGAGLTAAVLVNELRPVPRVSGLGAVSVRLELAVRVYQPMTAEPADAIDKSLLGACSLLMAAYAGDFELGGQLMEVDLLGAYGEGLGAAYGYIRQDGQLYRVGTITLPLIITDVWTEVA